MQVMCPPQVIDLTMTQWDSFHPLALKSSNVFPRFDHFRGKKIL